MADDPRGVEIRADATYDLVWLKANGWGVAALRTARRKGLKVYRSGRKSWVFGSDLLQFIRDSATIAGGAT